MMCTMAVGPPVADVSVGALLLCKRSEDCFVCATKERQHFARPARDTLTTGGEAKTLRRVHVRSSKECVLVHAMQQLQERYSEGAVAIVARALLRDD